MATQEDAVKRMVKILDDSYADTQDMELDFMSNAVHMSTSKRHIRPTMMTSQSHELASTESRGSNVTWLKQRNGWHRWSSNSRSRRRKRQLGSRSVSKNNLLYGLHKMNALP